MEEIDPITDGKGWPYIMRMDACLPSVPDANDPSASQTSAGVKSFRSQGMPIASRGVTPAPAFGRHGITTADQTGHSPKSPLIGPYRFHESDAYRGRFPLADEPDCPLRLSGDA